jgi:hypothetical protein
MVIYVLVCLFAKFALVRCFSLTNELKLPILQVFSENELKLEFLLGNELDRDKMETAQVKKRMRAGLSRFEESRDVEMDYGQSNVVWQNVYSDDHLQTQFESSLLLIYLYRTACSKCLIVDTFLDDVLCSMGSTKLVKADAQNVPSYVASIKHRLTGSTTLFPNGDINRVNNSNCSTCSNSGSIVCTTCGGNGMVTKGELTVICSKCVGYRSLRCPTCGGKCLKC